MFWSMDQLEKLNNIHSAKRHTLRMMVRRISTRGDVLGDREVSKFDSDCSVNTKYIIFGLFRDKLAYYISININHK